MYKKKIFWVLGTVLLLGLGSFIGYKMRLFDGLGLFQKHSENAENAENAENEEDYAEKPNFSNIFFFVGDKGFLLKGELLDPKFKSDFEKLPDTLYSLEFGEQIFAKKMNGDESNWTYSNLHIETLGELEDLDISLNMEKIFDYLKIAIQGGASYPKLSKNEECIVVNEETYYDTFGDNFNGTSETYGIQNLPYGVKIKLAEFFNSEEGSNFRFKLKGNQTSRDLIWYGSLTGKNKNEVAILLNHTGSNLDDRYILMVYAIKENGTHGALSDYFLVYNEEFYNRVLLENIWEKVDEVEYEKKPIYKNSDEPVETSFDAILLKQIDQSDYALVYDEKFDKLVKYVQRSKSSNEEEVSEEGEE